MATPRGLTYIPHTYIDPVGHVALATVEPHALPLKASNPHEG